MTKLLSQKTALYLGSGTGSPETFTKVGGITSVGAPESSRSEIDSTDLDSDAKEFMPGLIDYGSITFQMDYEPDLDIQQEIEDLCASGETRNWYILYSDGTTKKAFSAFGKSFNPAAGTDSKVTGPLTLRITGPVTTTYGA